VASVTECDEVLALTSAPTLERPAASPGAVDLPPRGVLRRGDAVTRANLDFQNGPAPPLLFLTRCGFVRTDGRQADSPCRAVRWLWHPAWPSKGCHVPHKPPPQPWCGPGLAARAASASQDAAPRARFPRKATTMACGADARWKRQGQGRDPRRLGAAL